MKRPRRESRPTSLGRYELVREIGRGGMGVIFEGRDPGQDRRVAIKVLPKQGDEDSERVGRFKREVQTIAMLSHQGIVRIFDVGEDAGRYYFVMEFVEGRSIKDLVEDGPGVPLRRGLEIIEQMCLSVAHAHRKGVIHRDINPNNILVETGGRAVLIDFGIAKLQDTSRLTRAGATIGTPRYLSPEQALGEPDVDERTDVYGLGATLYLLATGRPPFFDQGGKTVSLTAIEAGPTPPTQVNARVPREVETIIATAMARRRDARYRTPAEMATDIRSYLATGTLKLARPVRRGGQGWKLAVGLAVLLLGGGLVAAFGLGGGGRTPARRPPDPAPRDRTPAPAPAPTPALAPGAVPAGAQAPLVEADRLRAAGRHAEAIRAWFEALQEGAPERLVWLGRAESNAGLGKWDQALVDLARARDEAALADAAAALERRLLPAAAAALATEGPVVQRCDVLDRWLVVDPEGARAVEWFPTDAVRAGREVPALLERAAEHPAWPATGYLAALHELHERHDGAEARRLLDRVVAHAPQWAEGWRALALVASRAGDHEAAGRALERAASGHEGLRDLAVDAFLATRAAGRADDAARWRARALAALAGDAAGPEPALARALALAYARWNDPLAAAHHAEVVIRDLPAEHPERAEWVRRIAEWINAWDRLDPSQLATDNDRRYRRGSAVAIAATGDAAALERALDDLNTAVVADATRLMAATLYELRSNLFLKLARWDQFRRDVETGFARNPWNQNLRERRAWCLCAAGEGAAAIPLFDTLVTAADRRPEALNRLTVALRVAEAESTPAAGVARYLATLDGVKAQQPDARQFDAYQRDAAARLDAMAALAREPRPEVHAFRAALAAFREEWAEAERHGGLGAAAAAGAPPAVAARAAHALALVAARRFDGRPADRTAGERMLLALLGEGTGWDVDAAPADERRAAWVALAQAALAAGLPGRALQAAERARALGADAAALVDGALAAVRDRATSAYDLYRLGLLRAAAGDRFGARDALTRALKAEADGSLRDGERALVAAALREAR